MPPANSVMWFAVLGGPMAWAAQFVANLWFGFAQCGVPGRWELPVKAWQIGLSVGALAVGLGAMALCVVLYRRTAGDGMTETVRRGFGGRPPGGRVHFLAVCGLTVNFLALAIIVMTGIGAPLLTLCRQS